MIILIMRVDKVDVPLEGASVAVTVDAVVQNMDLLKEVEVQ
jgi:hypothetical protein